MLLMGELRKKGRGQGILLLFVFSAQVFCKPETAAKKSIFFQKSVIHNSNQTYRISKKLNEKYVRFIRGKAMDHQ